EDAVIRGFRADALCRDFPVLFEPLPVIRMDQNREGAFRWNKRVPVNTVDAVQPFRPVDRAVSAFPPGAADAGDIFRPAQLLLARPQRDLCRSAPGDVLGDLGEAG